MGRRRVAVIDPGPAMASHVAAVLAAVRGAESASILVTHGHADHSSAALDLAAEIGAPVWGPVSVEGVTRRLSDGDVIFTDEGDLVAIDTPGHARDHFAFHWPAHRGLFVGDLLIGAADTVWVGEYPGCVRDYLRSLERVRGLDPRVIYPAHGPPLENPEEALNRFLAHRRARVRQVEKALAERPDAGVEELFEIIYGKSLHERSRRAALMSIAALKEHVESCSE